MIYGDNVRAYWVNKKLSTYYFKRLSTRVDGFTEEKKLYPLKGFEETHQINRLGEVYSLRRNRYLIPKYYAGYANIRIDRRDLTIHRLVARTFDPEFFDGCHIHHIDEDKQNNRLDNLQCLTPDQHYNLHFPNGEENKLKALNRVPIQPNRLTREQVQTIRYLADIGYSIPDIASELGLAYHPVYRVVTNRTWGRIK